jgi:hypothetical protein
MDVPKSNFSLTPDQEQKLKSYARQMVEPGTRSVILELPCGASLEIHKEQPFEIRVVSLGFSIRISLNSIPALVKIFAAIAGMEVRERSPAEIASAKLGQIESIRMDVDVLVKRIKDAAYPKTLPPLISDLQSKVAELIDLEDEYEAFKLAMLSEMLPIDAK